MSPEGSYTKGNLQGVLIGSWWKLVKVRPGGRPSHWQSALEGVREIRSLPLFGSSLAWDVCRLFAACSYHNVLSLPEAPNLEEAMRVSLRVSAKVFF